MTSLSPAREQLPDPESILPEAALRDEEVESVLARAAELRFPDLRTMRGAERVEALIDHITATAIARGEVEELRLESQVGLYEVRGQLAGMPASGRNLKAVEDARRVAAPELAIKEAHYRWVIDRCTEQINRLGGTDYDAASRAYTLLAGT